MTDATDITGSLHDRQLAVYGMWVSVIWILGQRAAMAEPGTPVHDTGTSRESDVQPDAHTLPPVMASQTSDAGDAGAGEEPDRKPGEAGPDAAAVNAQPNAAASSPAGSLGQKTSSAADTYPSGDAGGNPAQVAQSPLPALAGNTAPGIGPAAGQGAGAPPGGEPLAVDIMVYAEFFAAKQFAGAWSDAVTFEMSAFGAGNVTVVAGDYYDIQISLDFGSFVIPATFAGGAEIAFGSALYSPASAYDLVVIDQDLVEINAIAQYNIGALSAAASGFDMQANQAVIAGYAQGGELQVTLGDTINVGTVQ